MCGKTSWLDYGRILYPGPFTLNQGKVSLIGKPEMHDIAVLYDIVLVGIVTLINLETIL